MWDINIRDFKQDIHPSCVIAPGAVVVGDVTMEQSCSVWYNAVIRGDIAPVRIAKLTNIQECSVVHTNFNLETVIGEGVTVGHGAILHGCKVGDYSLIGMGAIILDGAEVGKNCIIGAGALVTQGKKIPDGSLVVGNPGVIKRQVTPEEMENLRKQAEGYYKHACLVVGDKGRISFV